ncbi:MAG: methionine--tRNA ligase [Verrucomicrobia bacterium]|nr:methionine--tRNA ligase [Verrucomicrobiota bacterium]MBS0647212.1 methionine--tRNA ligase [Verrucomicrobiota bacterium]
MRQRVLVTAALPYANGPLHFGHIAGAYLPADCYARFERLQGRDVLYICGSDEYGVAITLSAELAGRTPKEHVDLYHEINQKFFSQLQIHFDHFSRTTTSFHQPIVHAFFQNLYGNGFIEPQDTEQLYSEADHRFLADRYVIGTCPRCGFEEARGDECGKCGASYEATDLKQPRSKLTGASLQKRCTRHWYLRFDRFREKLEAFLASRDWKPNVENFARQYVEDLRPRAITRDLEWGVPVPLAEAKDKVFYVWFDAPIGYISATVEWAAKKATPSAWEEYWLNPETKYVQFIGKDNIPFHAVFFPAMIMGQNRPYKLVDDLVANEFYNLEGKQFSKSDGWTIDLDLFFEHFSADQIRYVLAANAPETADSEFTWKDFQQRCNGELVGKFGNLINRVLVFIQTHGEGCRPSVAVKEEFDLQFEKDCLRLMSEIEQNYQGYRLRKVASLVMELAQLGNAYFDQKAPWKDVKDPARHDRMKTTLALCLEAIKYLALASSALMPDTAQKIWQMLGGEGSLADLNWKKVLEAKFITPKLQPPQLLFQRVEDDIIAIQVKRLKHMQETACAVQAPPYLPLKPQITIDQFQQVDLRVATILEVEKVPKSKKLLKLYVDLGFEKRTVVSGISLHYTPEQLVGKKVILVANLKPSTLMGVESQGMVLAGLHDDKLEVITVVDLPGGAEVS